MWVCYLTWATKIMWGECESATNIDQFQSRVENLNTLEHLFVNFNNKIDHPDHRVKTNWTTFATYHSLRVGWHRNLRSKYPLMNLYLGTRLDAILKIVICRCYSTIILNWPSVLDLDQTSTINKMFIRIWTISSNFISCSTIN